MRTTVTVDDTLCARTRTRRAGHAAGRPVPGRTGNVRACPGWSTPCSAWRSGARPAGRAAQPPGAGCPMSVLVDTSVWGEHFRRPLPALIQLLRVDDVLAHPLVMLELTCGTPPEPRVQTLGDLALLRQTRLATPGEVADRIERERLYERGYGAVDCTLVSLSRCSWRITILPSLCSSRNFPGPTDAVAQTNHEKQATFNRYAALSACEAIPFPHQT